MTDRIQPTAQTLRRTPHDDLDEPGAADPALDRPTFEEIAAEAYAIYLSHQTSGRDLEDWLEAEHRLSAARARRPEARASEVEED